MGQKNKNVLLWVSFFMDICINLATLYFVYVYLNGYIGAPFEKREMAVSLIVVAFTSLVYFMFNIYSFKLSSKLHMVLLKTIIAHIVAYFIEVCKRFFSFFNKNVANARVLCYTIIRKL